MKQKIILSEKGIKEVVRIALQNQFETGDVSADIPCLSSEEFGNLGRIVNDLIEETETKTGIDYERLSDKKILNVLSDLNISVELPLNFERR